MNKFLIYLVTAFVCISGIAEVNAQSIHPVCGTEIEWQQSIQKDPSILQQRQKLEQQIDQYLRANKTARTTGTDSDAVRIIPMVFHILHEGGSENISDDQVRNCISILNKDYRRKNADTVNTPLAFRAVAADTKIEFRLATKDPDGNCTNGITRTFTHRTNTFDNFTKSIIYWSSDKYLNIWVAKKIGNSQFGSNIGYAQFPGGRAETDGVVMLNGYVGNIGTANNTSAGRDLVHETGHYLNMLHLWGDNCSDGDSCADTPPEIGNYSGCPAYPHVSCGNNGDMTDNYMTFANGSCKDIWTKDQKARMRATLDVARFNLWQQSNLIATGTDSLSHSILNADSINPLCAPKADFLPRHKNICRNSTISFTGNIVNGTPTTWNWQFPGGTPSSSNLPNPTITYTTPGTHSVSLTVSNGQGSSTVTMANVAIVSWGFGVGSVPFSEGFEGNQPLPNDWIVINDDGGPEWQRTNRASYSGSYSMSVQNFETTTNTAPGSIKELRSPSYDLQFATQPVLTFRLSYGQQSALNKDSLSIGASFNCGISWIELKHLGGSALASGSGGFQPNDFAPANTGQWQLVSIPLTGTAFAGKSDVRFRFYFASSILSNNIYIDDINLNITNVGIHEAGNADFNFNSYPNPASESFFISYSLKQAAYLTINLFDLQGRLIRQLENKHVSPGIHEDNIDAKSFHLASGVYILKMSTPDGTISKKLIYSCD